MKRIWLSENRYALVDDDQYDWLNQFKWSESRHKSGRCYAIRRNENGIYVSMHREIKDLDGDYPVARHLVIDHVDDNGLNNQRRNLNPVTRQENTRRYHAKKFKARKIH
jgi:hypothetical protein